MFFDCQFTLNKFHPRRGYGVVNLVETGLLIGTIRIHTRMKKVIKREAKRKKERKKGNR